MGEDRKKSDQKRAVYVVGVTAVGQTAEQGEFIILMHSYAAERGHQ